MIIDKIDEQILRHLQKDARTPFNEIAERCGVSTDTISKRFRRMKKRGIIRGTTILLNPKDFGYQCIAGLGIDVSYPYSSEVVEMIREIPDVIFCTSSMGRHDLFGIAILKDVTRLSELKDLIKGHPMVKDVTTSIWVDQILLCPENFEFRHMDER
ncbi:MAG: Lrp/AsnC family transcriptional regulator [Candidatus Geothermarchaeales archaeon]